MESRRFAAFMLFDATFESRGQYVQIDIVRLGFFYFEIALARVSAVDLLVCFAQIGSLTNRTNYKKLIV